MEIFERVGLKSNAEKVDLQFKTVEGNDVLIAQVAELFEETIKPLYGDQSVAINKIRGGV